MKLLFLLLLVWPPAAFAQAPAARDDEAMAVARRAFESLPEISRRAIQDHLVWAGVYKGGLDGEFGRMTFNALRAFTGKRLDAAEGVLAPSDIAALAGVAAKAKAAAGFTIVQEPRAGVAIGVPQKIFSRRIDSGSGARFESADKNSSIETFRLRESETSLQTIYDNYRLPAPGRRVTYSVIRSDFIVIAAEMATRSVYTRVARAAGGNEIFLRGFTLSWPKLQQAQFEILTVAIANAFDPLGQSAAGDNAAGVKASPAVNSEAIKPFAVTPSAARVVSSAIAFAPNRYVAILPGPVCQDARVGTRHARLMKHDPASGLTLFDVPGGTGVRLRAPGEAAEANAPVIVLFATAEETGNIAVISVASGDTGENLNSANPLRLRAMLPAGSTGGLVLSRKGDLYGLVEPPPREARVLAGAPPPASRAILLAEKLGGFLTASGLELVPAQLNPVELSAGKLAADHRASIDALWCPAATGANR